MDKKPISKDPPLLAAATQAAKAMGLRIEVVKRAPERGGQHVDALVRITRGKAGTLYPVEVRPIRPATLGATLHQLDRLGPKALLITDYVTPTMAEELKARKVAFIDGAGNAFLDQPNFLVWITGRKPAGKPVPFTAGRAFQPNGLQLIFVLLCNPADVNMPIRQLAAMAGIANGTAGIAMQDLQAQGFVDDLKGKRGTRRLRKRERLLDQWTDAYVRVLRPRTLLGRYYVPDIDGWREWNLAKHGAQWGGEPAGALLTQYLRPGMLTLYADQFPGKLAALKRFAKEPEPGRTAPVEVRRRFWKRNDVAESAVTVPPLLVYADLLATADARCLETAKLIREAHVARLLEEG